MIECSFCCSSSQEDYIFAECSHLVCTACAGAKWDRKYSLRCCNKVTYLDEETASALLRMNEQEKIKVNKVYEKENRDNSYELSRSNASVSKDKVSPQDHQLEQSYCQRLKLEQSVLVRSPDPKGDHLFIDIHNKQKEQNLTIMEKILSEQISKAKCEFECQRKQIEKKEQQMLKNLYDTYSNHLNSLHSSVTHFDVKTLKQKLSKITNKSYESGKVVTMPVTLVEREQKQDKILEKLDYNQQKMKEKLHKHYELLK